MCFSLLSGLPGGGGMLQLPTLTDFSQGTGESCSLLCLSQQGRRKLYNHQSSLALAVQQASAMIPWCHQSSPACANRLGGECSQGVCQCLHLGGASPVTPAPPADDFRFANVSPLHIILKLFKVLLFCWVSEQVKPHASHLEGSLNFLQYFGTLEHQPHWFSKPEGLGLISLVQIPGIRMPDVGHQSLCSSGRSAHLIRSLPIMCPLFWGMGFW